MSAPKGFVPKKVGAKPAAAAGAGAAAPVAAAPVVKVNSTVKMLTPEERAAMLAAATGAQSTLDVMPMAVPGAGAGAGAAPKPTAAPTAAPKPAAAAPKPAAAAPKPAAAAPKPAAAAPKPAAAAPKPAAAAPKPAAAAPKPTLIAAPIIPVKIAGEQVIRPDMMEVIVTDKSDPRSALYTKGSTLAKYKDPKYNEYRAYSDQQEKEETEDKYLTAPYDYVPSTRKSFYSFVENTYSGMFSAALDSRSREIDPKACEKLLAGGTSRVIPFLYQRFVKEYTRMASPYRGLLVYHGLGSGKTCSAIAAAEALYGVANRRIIVMTPKSLRGNFIKELTFCGFRHFSTNNHWVRHELNIEYSDEFPDGKTSLIRELYARSVLGITLDYIAELKADFIRNGRAKEYRPSIWLPDFTKESNWKDLSKTEQALIQKQIDHIINTRIEFINYNGVSARILKEWACTGGHFDNAVIVIDEVHNLVRLMQGTIEPFLFRRGGRKRLIEIEPITPKRWSPALCDKDLNYKRGFLFYRLLCDARGSKVIGLSGTPIVNFPEELGILSNILTGYIDCFRIQLNTIVPAEIKKAIELISNERRIDVVRPTQGVNSTELVISVFTDGYLKAEKGAGEAAWRAAAGAGAGAGAGAAAEELPDPEAGAWASPITAPDGVIVDMTPDGPGMERIELIAARVYKNLKEAGFNAGKPVLQSFSRLPPDAATFRSTFIDVENYGLNASTVNILRKRLTGVISYYRGSKADFVPTVTTDEVVLCDMSPYVFTKYCEQRIEEINLEKQKKPEEKDSSLYAVVEMNAKSKNPSSYKFRSRAVCNFAFPESITRPYPSDTEKEAVVDAEAVPIDEDTIIGEGEIEPELDDDAEMAVEAEENAIDKALGLDEEEEEEGAAAAAPAAGAGAGAGAAAAAPAAGTGAGAGAGAALGLTGGGSNNENGNSVKSVKPKLVGANVETVAAAAGAGVGAQAYVTKTYNERIKDAMNKLDRNRNSFLKLRSAIPTETLAMYSPKLDRILNKLEESPGPNLVYSQFKTVEGLGVLGIALKANGYEEIKVLTTPKNEPYLPPETIASIQKGPGVPRFITFSGDGTREQKQCSLDIFNAQFSKLPANVRKVFEDSKDAEGKPLYDVTGEVKKYLHGEICKVIGITGAGAEGISLRNVRQVHIMEPYWNMVRIEQVKGRAVRICSHMDLPMEERNVEIYSYVMRFSDEQRGEAGEKGIPMAIQSVDVEMIKGDGGRKRAYIYTSDENVYFVAKRKEQITQSLLTLMKEVAVDCQMNAPDNEPDGLTCFVVAPPAEGSQDRKMFDPELAKDLTDAGIGAPRPGGAGAGAGAGARMAAAPAPVAVAAPKPKDMPVEYLTVRQKSSGDTIRYLIGPPDKDGYVFLYEETDKRFRKPVAKAQVSMTSGGTAYRVMKL